jgi:hypothetical protein
MKLVLLPGVYRKLMTKGGSFSIFGVGIGRKGIQGRGVCCNGPWGFCYVTPEEYEERWWWKSDMGIDTIGPLELSSSEIVSKILYLMA